MKVDLYIGDYKLDLFQDENIEINLSVVDIENIESNTTDFTRDFTVPASNNNNRLFKHYYNADIDDSFDARIKVDGSIFINGFLFKLGKYRLSKVIVKNNKPSSYTIQFWGNLLNLKDLLGNAYLSDLDLTAYDHSYNSNTVKSGLINILFSGDVIYPLLAKKQYYYNSDAGDTTQTDKLSNIAYVNDTGSNGIVWNDLRPSLKLIRIIEAIEVYTGITFSRDFFSRPEFTNLYLWLNKEANKDAGGDTQLIDWDSGDSSRMNLTTNIGSYLVSNTGGSNDNIHWDLYLYITPSAGYENVNYTVRFYKDGNLASEVTRSGTQILPRYELYTTGAPENPYTWSVYFDIKASQEFRYTSRLRQEWRKSNDGLGTFNTYASENTIDSNFIVSEEIPKIKVIDFLKGIFKMFKLVVVPVDFSNMYVNTLVDYYAEGELYDIARYVDNTEYTVSRGKLLNEINFKFEEPKTLLNIQYDKNNNRFYGDEENQIKDDNGKLLDGETLDFKVPFEQMIYERLVDINTNELVNVQYGAVIDENLEPADQKAHIHYYNNKVLGDKNVSFIDDLNNKIVIGTVNIPSHTMTLENVDYSTVFHEEVSEWNGIVITNTLYKNYHKNYIDAIFNPKRRDYKFKCKLPFNILSKLNLNDLLQINERYYRINDYNINLLTGLAELNLISSFDANVYKFQANKESVYVDFKAQIQSIYVTNLANSTFNKVDSGYGVDWVSVSSNLNNVYFSFAYNDTGVVREMFVDITNEEATKTIRIYLNQGSEVITVDSNLITVDNNLITVDNG